MEWEAEEIQEGEFPARHPGKGKVLWEGTFPEATPECGSLREGKGARRAAGRTLLPCERSRATQGSYKKHGKDLPVVWERERLGVAGKSEAVAAVSDFLTDGVSGRQLRR